MTSSTCDSCGGVALAKVRGQWLCARCGLAETNRIVNAAPAHESRRRVLRRTLGAAFGSSLAAKLLIGAAAAAAVGGVIVTNPDIDTSGHPPHPATPAVVSPAATTPSDSPVSGESVDSVPPEEPPVSTPDGKPPAVAAFNDALHEWVDCIQAAADAYSTEGREISTGFDPGVCGERPQPPAGNVAANPPGPPASTPGGPPAEPPGRSGDAPGRNR